MDKTLEELMDDAEQRGRNYFRQGLNCSECVLKTFMDMHETGLNDEALKLVTGFGGGMGHTKNSCGAVSGAVIALGTVKGRNPFDKEDINDRITELTEDIYPVFAGIVNEIKENYGSLICGELCEPYGDFDSRDRKKACQSLIGFCCRIAEKYANN